MRRAWALGCLAGLLLTAALPAAKLDEQKMLRGLLPAEPCSALWVLKAGDRFEYQWLPTEEFEGRSFLLLKLGPRRILLELRLADKAEPEVLERRAWILRRGRRLLTEVDGYAPCETRLGSPERRLDAALERAEQTKAWKKARWPKAPAAKAKAKPKPKPKP
jgi:hypothetical protein